MPDVETCVVLVAGTVNVSQQPAHGVEDGLGGAGVPLLAAWTQMADVSMLILYIQTHWTGSGSGTWGGEDVGLCLSLHQQQHLVPRPPNLQHLVRLQNLQSVLSSTSNHVSRVSNTIEQIYSDM